MRRLSYALIFFLFFSSPVRAQSLAWMDSFTDNDLAGWTFVDDEPNRDGPGLWRVDEQVLRQTSNIYYGLTPEEEYAKFLGTHIHAGNPEWKDYSFNCLVRSEDDDGLGILFRYRDAQNYYRLIMLDDANNRGSLRMCAKTASRFTSMGLCFLVPPTPLFPAAASDSCAMPTAARISIACGSPRNPWSMKSR